MSRNCECFIVKTPPPQYFEKAMVVSASMKTASARTYFFGIINFITAISIFSIQLLATGWRGVCGLAHKKALYDEDWRTCDD